MKSYPLEWYVEKLKKGERFSLARYGDGEFLCMWGRQGGNSNGCRYSQELREALLNSLKHKNDPTFIYGMQRVLPADQERAEKDYLNIDWHDTEVFSIAVAEGKLYPLIKQLKEMRLVVIGNESIKKFMQDNFNVVYFMEVPKANAFDFEITIPHLDNAVYLFSCGMAANAWVSKCHGMADSWFLDVGHIWDPFVGLMSRCDLEGKTLEDIAKNFKPYEETK